MRRDDILRKHNYNIIQNKNGRWYTRFNLNGKVVQRNRSTRKELEDLIVQFYQDGFDEEEIQDDTFSFAHAHDKWLVTQEDYGVSPNTIYKYEADWRRFFADTSFGKMDVREITSRDIEIFVIDRIRTLNLKQKAGNALIGYIEGVFYNLVIDRVIKRDDNPCEYVDKKKFRRYYNTAQKTPQQRVISPTEVSRLVTKVNDDISNNPRYLSPYGVKLALLTGMRSGEIAGLRWKNVFDDRIYICESEKFNSKTREYYQSDTKTGKTRNIPITNSIREFLDTMKQLHETYGCYEDFVISTATEKLRTRRLSDYMIKKSKSLGFEISKNIHTIRRTFNSYLRADGASALSAGGIIGNSIQVNNSNYTYDVDDMNTKYDLMLGAEQRILAGTAL